jgi:hypothetical protein
MKFRMTRVPRFWVDVEFDRIKNHTTGRTRARLIPQILRDFEKAGKAMRYLNTRGEIAWKATPGMRSRLADAEQEARDAMQLISSPSFQPKPSAKEAIPYSSAAMRQDLERVRSAWDDCQASRDRNAIYGYLTAVYGLVAWWMAEGREVDRARRALRLRRLAVSEPEDPFAAVIRCTADPAKADKRARSKWSRVMRYAAAYKPDSEPLEEFIRRKAGINECAARFTRRLGPSAARPDVGDEGDHQGARKIRCSALRGTFTSDIANSYCYW